MLLNRKMTWIKVIIFAVATAVVTAVLNLIPALNKTSFQDIAVNPDCWILFAVFIIVNCENRYEAAIKTFVFFLISQPLIYLLQVPFVPAGFGLFSYYKYWFGITVLTVPGAVIAYPIKRKDWLGVAVICVAVCYYGFACAMYFWNVVSSFPNHIISLVFCAAVSVLFAFALFDKKSHRAVIIGVLAVSFIICLFIMRPNSKEVFYLDEGVWSYAVEDENIAQIDVEDGNEVTVKAKNKGSTLVTFTDKSGSVVEYYITVSNGSVTTNKFD